MHTMDKLVSRSCYTVVRISFFISFICENECSPIQLLTIKQRNILVATRTFEKISSNLLAFIRVREAESLPIHLQ